MLSHEGYVAVCYAVGAFVAVAFAAYAFAYGWWWINKKSENKDTEGFVTARNTQSMFRIGWSFYAGAVGSWVIVTPSQYASFAGIVGVVVYAVSSGLPILMIAGFGGRMSKDMPHVFSLADFIGFRYGPIAKTLVFLITMFIMCIFVLAEYTTIGTIFSDFVGSVSWGITIIVGVLTLLYTAYGGLAVSIATDQAQGVASMLLAILLTVYVAVTYKEPIPQPLPDNLGPNFYGYISILTLIASLVASTMLNEAFWQRVWASSNRRALHGGAAVGFTAIALLIFLSGFGGWLAFAGGYITPETNPNVYLMQILGDRSSGGVAQVNNWVGVIVVLLSIIMNEGAVDSLQNGLAASISGQYLKNMPLIWTRVAVVVINVPLLVIATRNLQVLNLFLVGNLLACCAIFPLIFGLIPITRGFFSETGFVVGTLGGILGLTAVGIGVSWIPGNVATSFAVGANWAWYSNNYDWKPFVAALVCSAGCLILWDSVAYLLRKFAGVRGPGISGVLMRIPGMRAVTATPHWTPGGQEGDLPSTATWDNGKGIDPIAA